MISQKQKGDVTNTLTNIKDEYFNEFIHCMVYADDEYYTIGPGPDDAYAVNMYRRLLDVLLFLLCREDSTYKMYYSKSDCIAAANSLMYFCITEDDVYKSIFETLLENYGWEQPDGWNIEYYVNSDDRPCYSYENLYEFLEYRNIEEEDAADAIYQIGGYPFTLHNKKIDKAFSIFFKQQKNAKCINEYQELLNEVLGILQRILTLHVIEYPDICISSSKVYFVTVCASFVDYNGCECFMDLLKFCHPEMLTAIPLLDKKIQDFLEKWGE